MAMARTFQVSVNVIPSPKMKATYASWEFSKQYPAETSTVAVVQLLTDGVFVRQMEEDKFLAKAMKDGGIRIKAVNITE